MRLYNTATKALQGVPSAGDVRIYVCGITPYSASHMGHARTYLAYDVLTRALQARGQQVRMVRNVTDIDDPLFERAREIEVNWRTLGTRELQRFDCALDALNLLQPYAQVRVTDSMEEIVGEISLVEQAGATYQVGDTLFYSVDSQAAFGSLSGFDAAHQLALAAEFGGTPDDPRKRNPLDAVLWRPSASDEPSWPSPWGEGRPGWHIECVAIGKRELGPEITIHGGGKDLIFPHHEFENALATSIDGKPRVHHWMHVALLAYQGEKISKSLGNLVYVDEEIERSSCAAVRVALLEEHYRTEMEWLPESAPGAQKRVDRWAKSDGGAKDPHLVERVQEALMQDLDTPLALTFLDESAKHGIDVREAAERLGLRW